MTDYVPRDPAAEWAMIAAHPDGTAVLERWRAAEPVLELVASLRDLLATVEAPAPSGGSTAEGVLSALWRLIGAGDEHAVLALLAAAAPACRELSGRHGVPFGEVLSDVSLWVLETARADAAGERRARTGPVAAGPIRHPLGALFTYWDRRYRNAPRRRVPPERVESEDFAETCATRLAVRDMLSGAVAEGALSGEEAALLLSAAAGYRPCDLQDDVDVNARALAKRMSRARSRLRPAAEMVVA